MRVRLILMVLLSLVVVVEAEDFVCGNGVRPQCADTTGATRYIRSVDPSKVTDPTCVMLDENATPGITASQRALVETVSASHVHGRCHLKVEAGILVEMTQPEKDVVNAAIQAVLDEKQAYEDAATNNDLCHATLAELDTAKTALMTNLQGDIDGISNIATAKTELTDMMTRLVNALEKLMRCIRGRAGPPVAP
jgi:hypothetical protein